MRRDDVSTVRRLRSLLPRLRWRARMAAVRLRWAFSVLPMPWAAITLACVAAAAITASPQAKRDVGDESFVAEKACRAEALRIFSLPPAPTVTAKRTAANYVMSYPFRGEPGGPLLPEFKARLEWACGVLGKPLTPPPPPRGAGVPWRKVAALSRGVTAAQFVTPTPGPDCAYCAVGSVPADGTYFIWHRVVCPDASSDSFFVSVDNGPEWIDDACEGLWPCNDKWTVVTDRDLPGGIGTPKPIYLTAGEHLFVFRFRELGGQINEVVAADSLNDPPGTITPVPGFTFTPTPTVTPTRTLIVIYPTYTPSPTRTITPTPTKGAATRTPTPAWAKTVSVIDSRLSTLEQLVWTPTLTPTTTP